MAVGFGMKYLKKKSLLACNVEAELQHVKGFCDGSY